MPGRDAAQDVDGVEVMRHEEELRPERSQAVAGSVRFRKEVDERVDRQIVPRNIEQADVERLAVAGDDSGEIETLPDGCVSIPVFEEQLVVTKRLVVRERVLIRKRTVVEEREIEATLRRERLEIEADERIADRVHDDRSGGADPME